MMPARSRSAAFSGAILERSLVQTLFFRGFATRSTEIEPSVRIDCAEVGVAEIANSASRSAVKKKDADWAAAFSTVLHVRCNSSSKDDLTAARPVSPRKSTTSTEFNRVPTLVGLRENS